MSGDPAKIVIAIQSADSLVTARKMARQLALEIGVERNQATLVAAAISELARNIIEFAGSGEICLRFDGTRRLFIIARDHGPGIPDIRKALEPGYSTTDGLGLGLPGVRRIADDFEITSSPAGTSVTVAMTLAQAKDSPEIGRARVTRFGGILKDRRYPAKPAREPQTSAGADADGKDAPAQNRGSGEQG
jgi:serine/threonine-protein kinase RsbT